MFNIGAKGIQINLTGLPEVERQLLNIKSKDIPRATAAAIRYSAAGAPPAVAKGMRAHYNMTSTRAKKDVSVPRVGPMAQGAVVKLNRRPVTLMQFGAQQIGRKGRSRGVRARIYQNRSEINRKGFIGTAKQGVKLPLIRGGGGRRDLQVLYGPSLHGSFTNGLHADTLKDQVGQVLLHRLEVGVRRGIRQFGR